METISEMNYEFSHKQKMRNYSFDCLHFFVHQLDRIVAIVLIADIHRSPFWRKFLPLPEVEDYNSGCLPHRGGSPFYALVTSNHHTRWKFSASLNWTFGQDVTFDSRSSRISGTDARQSRKWMWNEHTPFTYLMKSESENPPRTNRCAGHIQTHAKRLRLLLLLRMKTERERDLHFAGHAYTERPNRKWSTI